MQQYQIHIKRAGEEKFSVLRPIEDAAQYNQPEIREAVEHMDARPHIAGTAVVLSGAIFNIIRFEQEALAPNSFEFPGGSL